METKTVGVLVGSLRRGSYSRQIAEAVMGMMPECFTMQKIDIGRLALFNQDFDDDGQTPPAWTEFRDTVRPLDGVLLVTPEYNRSVPPVLKNALDIGSRPYGKSVWDGKPCGVISVAPGKIGGFGANHHLRQTLTFLNLLTMAQPEAYIGGAADLLDAQGNLTNEGTRKFLQQYAQAFAQWIDRITPN